MSKAPIYSDCKFINKNTYLYYANSNEDHLESPPKGIVIEFPGLGGNSCLGGTMERGSYSSEKAIAFGKKGILVLYLFPGPWSWGNKGAIRMADAVVDAIAHKYTLGKDFPLVACGGSMGGLGALMYAAKSRHEISGVSVACPCVDALSTFDSHPDFLRTYISAVAPYDMELEDGLKDISPINFINVMPKGQYFICSDGKDQYFTEEQCDQYVQKLAEAGHKVEYHRQPGLLHGEFYPEILEKLYNSIETAILR